MLLGTLTIQAQPNPSAKRNLSLKQYLYAVGRQNLGYIAQRYNVGIAEAGIESAKVFPDPQLSVGAYDNQQAVKHLGRGYNASIGTTFELGGKRQARIGLAQSQSELAKAQVQDYFRNLRAEAALAYFNALLQEQLLRVQQASYQTMKQLAEADSVRYRLGAIAAIDARQSKLEAATLQNGVFQADAVFNSALVQLGQYMGKVQTDSLFFPNGNFDRLERNFVLSVLIDSAQASRADVVGAQRAKIVADKTLKLAVANRKIDLGLTLGAQQSGASTNETAPTPAYRSVNISVTVPLKLSNRYKGDIKAAQFGMAQSATLYDEVLQLINVEVTQAYFSYKASEKQVKQFRNGLLSEAEKVLEGKVYSYKRGESSLLELLNAQRTYNEVQQSYCQTLYDYAASLIDLERVAGIWDLE